MFITRRALWVSACVSQERYGLARTSLDCVPSVLKSCRRNKQILNPKALLFTRSEGMFKPLIGYNVLIHQTLDEPHILSRFTHECLQNSSHITTSQQFTTTITTTSHYGSMRGSYPVIWQYRVGASFSKWQGHMTLLYSTSTMDVSPAPAHGLISFINASPTRETLPSNLPTWIVVTITSLSRSQVGKAELGG